MGGFLKKYGESIYGTRAGPFVAPDEKMRPVNARGFALPGGNWWGGSTHKGNAIYLHVLRWPSDMIRLPAIPRRVIRHAVLSGGEAVLNQRESGIELGMPAAQRDPVDTIVKLELDGPAAGIPAIRSA